MRPATAIIAGFVALAVLCPCLCADAAGSQPAAHDCGSDPTPANKMPHNGCETSCVRDSTLEARKTAHCPVNQIGGEPPLLLISNVRIAALRDLAREDPAPVLPASQPTYILLSVRNL